MYLKRTVDSSDIRLKEIREKLNDALEQIEQLKTEIDEKDVVIMKLQGDIEDSDISYNNDKYEDNEYDPNYDIENNYEYKRDNDDNDNFDEDEDKDIEDKNEEVYDNDIFEEIRDILLNILDRMEQNDKSDRQHIDTTINSDSISNVEEE